MTRFVLLLFTTFTVALSARSASAQKLRPTDPIASVDGYPVFLGELNLLLMKKLGARDPSAVNPDVRRASTALIVRQHVAMIALKKQGGATLERMLQEDWEAFSSELKRSGLSASDYAKRYQSDEVSLRASLDWESAWKAYLKRHVTESNLKRLFEASPEQYAGSRWNVSHLFLPIDRSERDSKQVALYTAERIFQLLESEDKENRAQRFAELARQESAGATASDGGRIGWVSKSGDLPALVMASIRKTAENEVTQPIVTSRGVHLVMVHKRTAEKVAYEELADRTELRRDAVNRLFGALVADEKPRVTWLVESLRPPN